MFAHGRKWEIMLFWFLFELFWRYSLEQILCSGFFFLVGGATSQVSCKICHSIEYDLSGIYSEHGTVCKLLLQAGPDFHPFISVQTLVHSDSEVGGAASVELWIDQQILMWHAVTQDSGHRELGSKVEMFLAYWEQSAQPAVRLLQTKDRED